MLKPQKLRKYFIILVLTLITASVLFFIIPLFSPFLYSWTIQSTVISPLGISYLILILVFNFFTNIFSEGCFVCLLASMLINLAIFSIVDIFFLKKIFCQLQLTHLQKTTFSILFTINFYLILAILADLLIIIIAGTEGLSAFNF